METISIIIAEDHALMREGTRRILETNPDLKVVGEACDGEQAMNLLRRLRPDVAILDIRMPRLNGIEIVRQMNGCCPDTKALILTAYDDNEYIIALMEAIASSLCAAVSHPPAAAPTPPAGASEIVACWATAFLLTPSSLTLRA